jgi:predicted DNA-binding transcriptional regulator AlpA
MTTKICKRALHANKESVSPDFLRQSALLQRHVPFSAATLWRLVKSGRFPKPVKLTGQITAWRCSDIEDWAKDPEAYLAHEQGGKS